jgi:hypothetical protein
LGGSAERRARLLVDLAPLRRSRDLRLLVLGELARLLPGFRQQRTPEHPPERASRAGQ